MEGVERRGGGEGGNLAKSPTGNSRGICLDVDAYSDLSLSEDKNQDPEVHLFIYEFFH